MKRELYTGAQHYSLEQAVEAIENGICLAGLVADAGFYLRIDEYVPVICTAIHNGHNLRTELHGNCLLTPEQRFFEEDPYTDEFILSFPIVLIGNDSRFEYDLNRTLNQSTYFKSAWDKRVWKRTLSDKQRDTSHTKHRAFYKVLETLVGKIEVLHKSCIVFDIHSYNYTRHKKDTPTFNVGTEQIDMQRWSGIVKQYTQKLNKVQLPGLECRAAMNELFQGKGYLISHLNARFDNTLVLPTEVKKVFMDETSGEVYPVVLRELQTGLRNVFSDTAASFIKKHTCKNPRHESVASVLPGKLEDAVVEVDKGIYELWQCGNLDVFNYLDPLNYASEKRRFFERKEKRMPAFKYPQLTVDPWVLKSRLYRLQPDKIKDIGMQSFFIKLAVELDNRISLLADMGSECFVTSASRYFGKPTPAMLKAAEFIALAPDADEGEVEALITADEAMTLVQNYINESGISCKVEKSRKQVAKMRINSERKSLQFSASATFTRQELDSLICNQLNLQMVTALNSQQQPLKALTVGLPGYTQTMEGLGIYREFAAGNLTFSRLKSFAIRTLATQHMLQNNHFVATWRYLCEEFETEPELAFSVTTRVYRGGGITKEHQYLSGFAEILNCPHPEDLVLLTYGKSGLTMLPFLKEFHARGLLVQNKSPTLFDRVDPAGEEGLTLFIEAIKKAGSV